MTITLDTNLMTAMAAGVAGAKLELENCIAVMGRIVEHHDWCCQERELINEAIRQLQQEVRLLGEDMEQFSSAIRSAASDFSDMGQSIPAMFQELDAMLGQLSAVSPSGVAAPNSVTAGIARRAVEESAASGRFESYSAGSLTEDIRVCRFADFAPQE